ncbi:MAG: hypothetical protein RMJ16_12090, partial [Thermoguttaceae bacterium]|nr:hypothetical protein [Thermoguttaceae bacterium]
AKAWVRELKQRLKALAAAVPGPGRKDGGTAAEKALPGIPTPPPIQLGQSSEASPERHIRPAWRKIAPVVAAAIASAGVLVTVFARVLTPNVRPPVGPWRLADAVECVAFSPDGSKILTGSGDGTARLWDAATGRELRTFQGHTHSVISVAFSPDGSKVLTGSADGTARLWSAATGEEMLQLWHLTDGRWVAITPKGYFDYDGTPETLEKICLVDRTTGRPLSVDEVRAFHRPDLVRQALRGSKR